MKDKEFLNNYQSNPNRVYKLNPNRKYALNEKGEIIRIKEPHLLGLFNKKIRYAYAYCRLKQIYLTKEDVSSKRCFWKGKDYCRHLYLLEGNERVKGIKNAKQKKWEGEKPKC